jgi:LysR family hydrogen peroxide-inducible transcriptional activator
MQRPTLRQLEYAVAVEQLCSFSRAAEQLHVSQPGLSAQIAELERRLGVVLFERTRTVTSPTPAGRDVLARARDLLRDADDLLRAAETHRGTIAGVLRVGAIPTIAPYLLSTVARQMHCLWPDVQLELSEARTTDLVSSVTAGRVDVGLLATPVATGTLTVADLAFEPFVVAVADTNLLAGRKRMRVDELGEMEVLLLEDGHCLRDHALAVCNLAGLANHRDVHDAGLAVLAQMVAASDAATLLPAAAVAVEARPGAGLATVGLAEGDVGRTLSLVWRAGDPRADFYARVAPRLAAAVQQALHGRPTSRAR